ncbi:hypothetical protein M427DRAFT_72576 [Gonapodya prolifera JEL478]|uniref:SH3 domain-containing protein n=1 Tax=Gonapodya prolifera (strain JEL478) TaxID=1344416 RepID=A0A139A4T4_GONPJ|nr:hypothetical protein M427DRAFT_72576 [Gonapodya prolifera JEL478]|eukprot:KXS11822.1 hypothetical protein M427DRAFT_72576 [Gonapodya prolifera JEL478]
MRVEPASQPLPHRLRRRQSLDPTSAGDGRALRILAAAQAAAPAPTPAISPHFESENTVLIALVAFTARKADVLSFGKGDELLVEQRFADGWAQALNMLNGHRGLVPMSHLSTAPPPPSAAPSRPNDFSRPLAFGDQCTIRTVVTAAVPSGRTDAYKWAGNCGPEAAVSGRLEGGA